MIIECQSLQDFEQILQHSHERPVFLFKHSSVCGVSDCAWDQFNEFAGKEPGAEYWRVLAVEQRALSQAIAQRCEVRHESPQILLFQNGRVSWHTAHWRIRMKALQEAWQRWVLPGSPLPSKEF